MSSKRNILALAVFLLGGVQNSPATDPGPLKLEFVKGTTLVELSKILAGTDLRRLPLRLVLDEKTTPISAEDKTVPQIRHHVLMVEPGSKRLRYDRVDYGSSGNAPYVCSSFTDGVQAGRWESGLRPDDIPRLLKGDALVIQRRGMCYIGPNVCYSPDIVLRVMGLTMGGKPMADKVRELGDDAVITPDNAGDGLVFSTKFKKLTLDAHGVLRQYLMFRSDPEGGVGGDLTMEESILVTKSGHVGSIPLPTQMHRYLNIREFSEDSVFELRVADCRVLTSQEMIEATNPWISEGTVLLDGKNGLTLEKDRRAFGPMESSTDLPKGRQ